MTNKLAKCFKGSVLFNVLFCSKFKKTATRNRDRHPWLWANECRTWISLAVSFQWSKLKKKLTDYEKINVLSCLV